MPDFPSSTSASGIWQMRQVKRAVQGGNWPSVAISDPYFDYVPLLLPGTGTNGAQNNTFLDSSTNAFSITRNGNTTQGTFTPYGSNWSNFFDGSGDYLSVPGSSAFAYGTGSFTIEFWIFGLIANDRMIYDARNGGGTGPQHFTTGGYGGSLIGALRYVGSSEIISTAIISDNTWHHCAIVRNGSSAVTLYVDGVASGSGTDTTNYTATSGNNLICRNSYGAGGEFNGYLSNFRIVKGVALYTSNFTPSTTPLTAVANTSLLTCQSNRFIDNSSNNFTVTSFGETSVQRFSPFNPTSAYSTTTIGGSGYFDGSGDWLSFGAQSSFNCGTANDFCMEVWAYRIGTGMHFWSAHQAGVADGFYFTSATGAGEFPSLQVFSGGGGGGGVSSNKLMPQYAWTHIIVTRQSGVLRLFLNGEMTGYTTTNRQVNTDGRAVGISGGINFVGGAGYISQSRYINGSVPTAYQTSSTTLNTQVFTPPTAPLSTTSQGATANDVKGLVLYANAGIIDNAMMNNLETVGNAQISTAQSKFGGGSMAFDGNGDWLNLLTTPNITFGSGNFTLEGWLYLNSVSGDQIIFDQRPASTQGAYPVLYMSNAVLTWYISTGPRIQSSSLSTGVWYHFAVSRSGSSTRMFINGNQTGSTYTDTNNYLASRSVVGISAFDLAGGFLNGYLDDLRITKGFARYTSNFSVPTAPFPTQ